MSETPGRVIVLIGSLLAIWIVVYWMWTPSQPRVTFGERPASLVQLGTQGPAGLTTNAGTGDPMPRREAPYTPMITRPEQPRSATKHEPKADPTTDARLVARDAAKPGVAVIPPKFTEYTVQKGDISFEQIAQKTLGDRRRAEDISRANPLVSPDKLRPGKTVLRIPLEPGNVQGRVVARPDPAPEPEPTKPEPAKPVPAPPAEREYATQAGDTLSTISQKVYGRSGLWRQIYEANRDRLESPDAVPQGVTLRIPPAPAR